MKPIGIVIPTYNRWDALQECLRRLEKQTVSDFDVVLVDDGSTDGTSERIHDYLRNSPLSVRYLRQSNAGPAKARNHGVSILQSRVCLFLGDDIFAEADLVEKHLALHQQRPALEVAGLGLTLWSTTGQIVTPFMQWFGQSPYQFDYKSLLSGAKPDWHHFYTSNLSVKTELLQKFPFDESFPYAAVEDIELAYRMHREHGLEIVFLRDAIAYHLHPTTFRQACQRMIKVGYSWRMFEERWPEQQVTQEKKPLRRLFARHPKLVDGLVWGTDMLARVRLPERLVQAALICHFDIGRESARNSAGQLVRR